MKVGSFGRGLSERFHLRRVTKVLLSVGDLTLPEGSVGCLFTGSHFVPFLYERCTTSPGEEVGSDFSFFEEVVLPQRFVSVEIYLTLMLPLIEVSISDTTVLLNLFTLPTKDSLGIRKKEEGKTNSELR